MYVSAIPPKIGALALTADKLPDTLEPWRRKGGEGGEREGGD